MLLTIQPEIFFQAFTFAVCPCPCSLPTEIYQYSMKPLMILYGVGGKITKDFAVCRHSESVFHKASPNPCD